MKIIFFGTPQFAAIILKYLIDFCKKPDFELAAVITRPDKPSGRGLRSHPSEVKRLSQSHNLSVINSPKVIEITKVVKAKNPDLLVVAAYMPLLPKELLDLPKFGGLNVHPSLLPKYAGVSPIQQTILRGEKETGVTILKMNPRYDEGKIVSQTKLKILPHETAPELENRLAHLGGRLLVKIIPEFAKGKITPEPQDLNLLKKHYTGKLNRQNGLVTWQELLEAIKGESWQKALKIDRMVRAFTPWPGVWTMVKAEGKRQKVNTRKQKGEKRVKILKAHLKEKKLAIDQVQLGGKRPITWPEFVAGYKQVLDL